MSVRPEYLPATGVSRQELVLLHGWGSNRDVWRPMLGAVREWANVTLLDIPGCAPQGGQVASVSLDDAVDAVLDASPDRAVYIGWSLGGQLATEIAVRQPERVTALVTLCSNPSFVARDDWPGMARDTFTAFYERVDDNPCAGLKRFQALQAQGAENEAVLRRSFRALLQASGRQAGGSLLAGLAWLQSLDQRSSLEHLQLPQLHLQGECDALVPASCTAALTRLLVQTPGAQVHTLRGASHAAPLEVPELLATELNRFLAGAKLLEGQAVDTPHIEKRAVADSFSRAAQTYDDMAHLQHAVGERLLERLDSLAAAPATMLDLGCGTGYFRPALKQRFASADYIGLDLAPGMVNYARERGVVADSWLVGDAEALPLATESVDLIFSSLAVQWCYRPVQLFAELHRVLRPGGHCVFTSLGPGTLQELRAAWAAVDSRQHVNEFLPVEELQQAAEKVPGLQLALESEGCCMRYARVRELLAELKAIGAHNMNRGRPEGLTGRRALSGMLRAYEDWRDEGQLPATYDVVFGTFSKQ